MKKLFSTILVLGLLLSGNAYANNYFNQCNMKGKQVNFSINLKFKTILGQSNNQSRIYKIESITKNEIKTVKFPWIRSDQFAFQYIFNASDNSLTSVIYQNKNGGYNEFASSSKFYCSNVNLIAEKPKEIAEKPKEEEKEQVAKVQKTNDAYAIAKIAGIKMCQSYDEQYKTKGKCLMPTDINKIKPAANIKKEYRIKDDNVISSLFLSTLPPCEGDYGTITWSDCHATWTYLNGDKYIGEWKNNMRHGNGTIFWKTPLHDTYNLYVGEWQNDNEEGKGVLYRDKWGDNKYERYPGCWNDYYFTKIEMYALINDVNPCGNLVKTYFCKGMKCSKEEYDITQKRENQKRSTYANVYSEFDNCPKIYDYLVTKMYTYSQNTAQHNLLKNLALKTKKMIKTSGGYDSNSVSWCQDWMVMGLESTGGL